MKVSVIGAGTMGAGIAQVAATNGHEVCLFDSFDGAIKNAETKLTKILNRLVEKEKISDQEKDDILSRIKFSKKLEDINGSGLVIEAIIENLEIKQKIFAAAEGGRFFLKFPKPFKNTVVLNQIFPNCLVNLNSSKTLKINNIIGFRA